MITKLVKISEVKANPKNPRLIKDEAFAKLVESVKSFPEMLDIRPIVVNSDMMILGGNMRWKACKEAGMKEVPVVVADNLTKEQEEEFLVKDNVSGGEWDWSILAQDWDMDLLTEWGLETIGFDLEDSPDDMDDDFELPSGDKNPFGQLTFMLADKQAEAIKNELSEIKKMEEYKYMETFGNENSNGNSLYLLVMEYIKLKNKNG
jgi:ParB-like chromosome segregation protein Spo0J